MSKQLYKCILVTVVLCLGYFVIRQTFSIKQSSNSKSVTSHVESWLESSYKNRNEGDFKKFLATQNAILTYSKKNNYSKGIAMSNHYIGIYYQNFGDCGKALRFFNIAL